MRRIIDFHAHIGDIFHEQKNIIFKKPLSCGEYTDPFLDLEESGFSRPLIVPDVKAQNTLIDAGQYRTWEYGSLEAVSKRHDESGITYVNMMPVLPNISVEDVMAASLFEPRIVYFTSPDFSLPVEEMTKKLRADITKGAKGLKLHPIIQNVHLLDERSIAAIKVFGELGLPITSHCGVNDYYKPDSPFLKLTNKDYGSVYDMIELIKKFPDYKIIPAHGGGTNGGEMEILANEVKGYENVWVDTSFRGADYMQKAVKLFGEDRVLFATDNPFTNPKYGVFECEKAFASEPIVKDKVFYLNAAKLLGLPQ